MGHLNSQEVERETAITVAKLMVVQGNNTCHHYRRSPFPW